MSRQGPRQLTINGKVTSIDVPDGAALLWAIREECGLTGTKFGCGMGLCGACTVHLDGAAVRSCVTPIEACGVTARITTIEGLALGLVQPGDATTQGVVGNALIAAWIRHNVPQCGYCQSGQLMSAADLLARNLRPTDADVDSAMAGNICRCGTYQRIRAAIMDAAAELRSAKARP